MYIAAEIVRRHGGTINVKSTEGKGATFCFALPINSNEQELERICNIKSSCKGMNFAKPMQMRKRILVADDDSGIQDIFKIIFEKAGYDVEIKEDASELFKNNFVVPDIFLVDKLLSGVDGTDICRFLKNDPRTLHVPVVMVSASPDLGAAASNAGADDFVEKPFDMNYLLQVIERNISKRKNGKSTKRTMG